MGITGIEGGHTCEHQFCKLGPQPTTDGLGSKLSKLLKMISSYVDVVRDAVLVGVLVTITAAYQGFIVEDLTLFPNVVIMILLSTLTIPLLVGAVCTSIRHPFAIFEFPVWNNYRTKPAGEWEYLFIQLLVFSCYLFVPAILINNKENAILRKKILEEKGKDEYEEKKGKVSNVLQ